MKATTYIEFVQTVMQMDRASKLHGSMLEGMNIQGATGLTHARAATLKALGAIALLSVQSPPIYSEQSTPDIHFGNINSFQENSMQPVPNQERQTAEAFAAHLALVGKDVQAWVDLFAENAVVEFPYASTTPGRLEGKEAIYNYMKDVPAQMQDLVFTNVRIYPTSNPNVLFAEVHGEAVIVSTGHHYQQDYVMRLETKEGKIIHYREYWNPIPALEAWGGTQNLRQSFNADSVA